MKKWNATGRESGEHRWAVVESGRTTYGARMDGKSEKEFHTDNDHQMYCQISEILKELLEEPVDKKVYIINYLWTYFDLNDEFDEAVKAGLLKLLGEKRKPDKAGASPEEQLFSRMTAELLRTLKGCGAVYEAKSRESLVPKSWTEAKVRKLLLNMSEEDFIQTFAPALGLSVYEINDFLLKAYRRSELNPYEKEEFLLYLAVLQTDSDCSEQSYYFLYRKMCLAYDQCGSSALPLEGAPRTLWKEAECTVAILKKEMPDWTGRENIPEVLTTLFEKHKAMNCLEDNWDLLRKRTVLKLWKEIRQLYCPELSYIETDRKDDQRYKKKHINKDVNRTDGSIWKKARLKVKICRGVSAGMQEYMVKLHLPENSGKTTLIPVRTDQIRNLEEGDQEKETDGTIQTVYRLNLECQYGVWIPAGTVLTVMQPEGVWTTYETVEEYLGIGSEEMLRFLYGATELLDEEKDAEIITEQEADLSILSGWFEKTKLDRRVFHGFERLTDRMAQRNYILTLLFLKFVKTEEINEMEKETRRGRFLVMADKALGELQLPATYLALPYDVLLYYLLANVDPVTEFRLLWAWFGCNK